MAGGTRRSNEDGGYDVNTMIKVSSVSLSLLWRTLLVIGRIILWVCPILLLIAFWEFITQANIVNKSVLPTFSAITAAWYDLFQEGLILPHLVISLYRSMVGLIIGSLAGVSLGILMGRSQIIREIAEPLVTLTFTLPKTAFIPIVLLWLGVGNTSIIFVVFLSTLVPLTISAFHGTRAIPKEFVWSARSMGASNARILTSIVLPATLVYIVNGFRISLAFAMVVVISSEMVASYNGIGQFILVFSESGNYNYMFAGIFTVTVVAFFIDRCFLMLSRYLLRWVDGTED